MKNKESECMVTQAKHIAFLKNRSQQAKSYSIFDKIMV